MIFSPRKLALLALATIGLAFSALASSPTISFSTAKQKAAREGKVLLVDFTATWCMPCRWMDETTFSDQQVLSYLRENYVSIKVDIDDFDGFALKQQYNVSTLPTMLFFASDGRQVDRVEEGVGAVEMLERLRQNNTSGNRIKLGGQAPVNDWTEPFAQMSNKYSEESHTAPSEFVVSQQIHTTAPTTTIAAPQVVYASTTTSQPVIEARSYATESISAIETREIVTEEVLAEITVADLEREVYIGSAETEELVASAETEATHKPVEGSPVVFKHTTPAPKMRADQIRLFSLQAGVYSNRNNAVRAADHLRDFTETAVLIEFDRIGDNAVYRIYVGRFTDMEDAEALSANLQLSGFSCIPKELAMN
ncbi:MAG: thioredoxin family protein [Saprospiraceae bacterium]